MLPLIVDAPYAISISLTMLYVRSDAVVSQVLDELGLQLNEELAGIPQTAGSLPGTAQKQPTAAAAAAAGGGSPLSDADADLQARLDNLRRE